MFLKSEEEPPTSLKEELKGFCETTTLVGLAHVVGERFRWARIFWAIAFLGALAAAVYQVSFIIQKYLLFEITTEVSYKNSKTQRFPVVTICNLNPLQRDKIEDYGDKTLNDLYKYYQFPGDFSTKQQLQNLFQDNFIPKIQEECVEFIKAWNASVAKGTDYDYNEHDEYDEDGNPMDTFCDRVGFAEETYDLCINCVVAHAEADPAEKAKDLLREKLTQMRYSLLKNLTQTKEEMVVSCSILGKPCHPEDFGYVLDPRYGRCIQYPKPKQSQGLSFFKTKKAQFTGPAYGLKLVLNLDRDQYSFASNIGLRVELHPPNTTAYPYTNGFYVSPGKMTSVAISKLRIRRLDRPYGFCVDINNQKDLDEQYRHIAQMKDLYNLTSYTQADCESICKYETIKDDCKCRVRETPHAWINKKGKDGDDLRYCTISDRQCIRDAKHKFEDDLETKGHCACGAAIELPKLLFKQCPRQCDETIYKNEISSADYPSDGSFHEVATMLQKKEHFRRQFELPDKVFNKNWYVDEYDDDDKTEFEDKVRRNLVRINLFYRDLNYEQVKQKPNYEFIQLVSDLGGNTGLWVGFCVLTLVEWIVLMVNICYVCCYGGRNGKKLGSTSPSLEKMPSLEKKNGLFNKAMF